MLKSRESGQEKVASCHGDGATPDEHVGDGAILEASLHVDAAGSEDLNSLLQYGRVLAPDEAVLDEPGDGATGGGAGRWILAAGPLHTSVPVCTGARRGSGDREEEFGAGGFKVGPGEGLRESNRRATSSERRGTMQNGRPVETVCAG